MAETAVAAVEAAEPDFDYTTLMDPKPTPTPKETEPEPPAAVVEEKSEKTEPAKEADASDSKKEEPKPGTPDVALQHAQQRMSAITDKIDALMAKIEAQDGKATAAQAAQLQTAKDQADELAKLLDPAYEIDVYKDTKIVAKRVQDTEKKVSEAGENTSKEIAQLRQEVAELRADTVWRKEVEQYPGMNPQEIYQKAVEDAVTEISEEHSLAGVRLSDEQAQKVIEARATRLYRARIDAAAKSVAAKKEPDPKPVPVVAKPAARILPPKTAGGASVTNITASPAPGLIDSSVVTEADYRALITK